LNASAISNKFILFPFVFSVVAAVDQPQKNRKTRNKPFGVRSAETLTADDADDTDQERSDKKSFLICVICGQ
jgi:hypothetical protein